MATTLFMCMLVAYVLYSLAWRFLGFGNPIGFYWSTLFTHPFKVPVSMFSERTRTAFNNTTLRAPRLMDNHSHPGQAALRSSAVLALRTLAFSVGMKPYFVQRSKSDNRSGLEGCETVVWAKDAHRKPVAFAPGPKHLIMLVDTSDHVQGMDLILAEGQPTAVFTVVPSRAARMCKEYCYTFNEDNELVYEVKGGAGYRQEVWDLGGDMVTAIGYSATGLYRYKTVFNIDRKYVDDDHQIVLFSPSERYAFPLFDMNPWINRPLKRLHLWGTAG